MSTGQDFGREPIALTEPGFYVSPVLRKLQVRRNQSDMSGDGEVLGLQVSDDSGITLHLSLSREILAALARSLIPLCPPEGWMREGDCLEKKPADP